MSKKSKVTLADRLIAGLTHLGFKEFECRSSKYREFRKQGFRNYFVGKKGALRCGDSASSSWSMGDPAKQTSTFKKVLAEGDKALKGKEEINLSGLTACDSATLATVADSDPVLAAALRS